MTRNIDQFIYKTDPLNFVPFSRTPWAGEKLSFYKKNLGTNIPTSIGETWEISTDAQYPSLISGSTKLLKDCIKENPIPLLGSSIVKKYGTQNCPLLLKWLHAKQPLSVQLHPPHGHPLLKEGECGKPESWFVFDVEETGHVYLGFQDKPNLKELIAQGKWEECLYRYEPKKFDYISVPPGLVHSVGPGVAVLEPQHILENLSGKTWRLYDWDRKYDNKGQLSPNGQPRELHTKEALHAICFDYPKGDAIKETFVISMKERMLFEGNKYNPFALLVLKESGSYQFSSLIPPSLQNQFFVVSCVQGQASLEWENESITISQGESAFIGAQAIQTLLVKAKDPLLSFFTLAENHHGIGT